MKINFDFSKKNSLFIVVTKKKVVVGVKLRLKILSTVRAYACLSYIPLTSTNPVTAITDYQKLSKTMGDGIFPKHFQIKSLKKKNF